jgi:hypothetical protein
MNNTPLDLNGAPQSTRIVLVPTGENLEEHRLSLRGLAQEAGEGEILPQTLHDVVVPDPLGKTGVSVFLGGRLAG